MKRGKVVPSEFNTTIKISLTSKGTMLVPSQYENTIKNYLFDTGAQLSNIQREQLKGKKVIVRGASNRKIQSGTEVLKSFKIGKVAFKNTFATNSNSEYLNDQIPNFGGIIGRTIIDRANWLIDLPNRTLTLSNKDLSNDRFTDIELILNRNGAPYTMINVDGKSYKSIIDLGSSSMLNVPNTAELATELMASYTFEDRTRDRYTVGGVRTIREKIGIIPAIKIGEIEFKNVEVTINESSQIRVGINLFEGKLIYIDNLNYKYRVQ